MQQDITPLSLGVKYPIPPILRSSTRVVCLISWYHHGPIWLEEAQSQVLEVWQRGSLIVRGRRAMTRC